MKGLISGKRPYGEWLAQERITLADIASTAPAPSLDNAQTLERMQAFGYTTETMQFMLIPLVTEARDPLGSMGNDSALACLSDKPRMIYDYFKQLFAQVTNPPIDSIREEVVMSLRCFIGPEGNLLETTPEQVRRLNLEHPILSNQQLTDLSQMDQGLRSCVIDITFAAGQPSGFMDAMERICREASQAIDEGYAFIILSDRNISQSRIPLSALIATGAVHQHLLKNELRSQIGIVVETGEAREVHHHCLLTGYGADAVNPYLAFEALWRANTEGLLGDKYSTEDSLVAAYKKGVAKGMMKVMAKMGISTLHSYKELRSSRPSAWQMKSLRSALLAPPAGYRASISASCQKKVGGDMRSAIPKKTPSNSGSEQSRRFSLAHRRRWHMWNPNTIFNLQLAARNNSADPTRNLRGM